VEIVKRLVAHLVPSNNGDGSPHATFPPPSVVVDPQYRADIIHRIIFICSQNSYHNVTNFEWYISILVGLTYVPDVSVGDLLTDQIMDVGVRVKSAREFSVKQMVCVCEISWICDKPLMNPFYSSEYWLTSNFLKT
jgi:AP-3 complex subunit delta-1